MSLAFVDRPLNDLELKRFRLVLSTYQDYTYQDDPDAPQVARGCTKRLRRPNSVDVLLRPASRFRQQAVCIPARVEL